METLLERKGVKVEVWFEGERLSPDVDGYLGGDLQFKKEGGRVYYFSLKCYVPVSERVYGMMVDGKKNVILMKNHSRDPSVALFSMKIPAKDENYGVLVTEYPQNNLRLLILKEEGRFEVWEIAIVSQDGLFFLTEQMDYEAQCFLDDTGEVVCPRLAKWPQLIQLLASLVKKEELLSISQYIPLPTPKADDLPFQQGRVVWWNYAQGLGAIVIDKKGTQAKVHWRDLIDQSGQLRALQPGQIVSYQRLVLPRQSKGRITGFLFEAIGVKPI